MILAQQLQSGEVRYIEVAHYDRESFIPLLKTFYPNEVRVTALLDLGGLYQLGSTPYGMYRFDGTDEVHCQSLIRDHKNSRGANKVKYATISELSNMRGYIFLFKDGRWCYFDGVEFMPELPIELPIQKYNSMIGLEYRTLSKENEITQMYGTDLKSWAELQAKSDESGTPIFVFRGDKLITTINHPLNR